MILTWEQFKALWEGRSTMLDGIPSADQAKLECCVQAVKSQGRSQEAAFAICNAAIEDQEECSCPDKENCECEGDPSGTVTLGTSDQANLLKEGRVTTDEGYLIVDAVLARTGVQEYMAYQLGNPPGYGPLDTIRVYRAPEDVFDGESLASFALKPVTNNHPDIGLLDQATIKKYQVGTIGENIVRDGDTMRAKIIITDPLAVSDVNSGKLELSNGYRSEYVFGAGKTPSGETYDARQTVIRGNHVALVDKGRCGPECRVLDQLEEKPMEFEIVTVDGVDIKVAKGESAQVLRRSLASHQTALDAKDEEVRSAKGDRDTLQASLDTAEGERDGLKEELKTAKESIPTGDALDALITEHVAFKEHVKALVPNMDTAKKTMPEIKAAVVGELMPNTMLDGKSDEYVDGIFATLVASLDTRGTDKLRRALTNTDADVVDSSSAREKHLARTNTAVKGFDSK